MKLDRPMKYIVLRERAPMNETQKGREPNECMVIFDARLSPVMVAAGVAGRCFDLLNDANIVEQGDWQAATLAYEPDYTPNLQRLAKELGGCPADWDGVFRRMQFIRSELEAFERIKEALKANEAHMEQLRSTPMERRRK